MSAQQFSDAKAGIEAGRAPVPGWWSFDQGRTWEPSRYDGDATRDAPMPAQAPASVAPARAPSPVPAPVMKSQADAMGTIQGL